MRSVSRQQQAAKNMKVENWKYVLATLRRGYDGGTG